MNTYAFAANPTDRTNIAEHTGTYLATPAATSPQLRAAEIARVAEQVAVTRAKNGPRLISSFWQAPAAPAAPPAA